MINKNLDKYAKLFFIKFLVLGLIDVYRRDGKIGISFKNIFTKRSYFNFIFIKLSMLPH